MLVLSREQTVGDSGQTWNLSFLATSPGGSSLCLQRVLFRSAVLVENCFDQLHLQSRGDIDTFCVIHCRQ